MSLFDSLALPAAYQIETFDEIECLRAKATERANAGAEEATLLIAGNLTAARGYQQKQWQGFQENFHASLILEPECDPSRYHEMQILGVTSLGSSIATHVAPMTSLTYSWPNDLYIAGQKVASVWLDKGQSANGPWLSITASVNLMHAPGDDSGDFSLPTMSLREAEGNSDITAAVLLETWAKQFIAEINNWDERGFVHILAYWKVRAEKKQLVDVALVDGRVITGMQSGIYDDGSCVVTQENGESVDLTLPQYMHWE